MGISEGSATFHIVGFLSPPICPSTRTLVPAVYPVHVHSRHIQLGLVLPTALVWCGLPLGRPDDMMVLLVCLYRVLSDFRAGLAAFPHLSGHSTAARAVNVPSYGRYLFPVLIVSPRGRAMTSVAASDASTTLYNRLS